MIGLPTRWKLRPTARLAIIVGIFFISFLTFNILFQASSGNDYFKEIIAALIGTILAAVITTMLLSSQTQGEEIKERNVEVFRKKVDTYQEFLDIALQCLDDEEISQEEARKLRNITYRLSLFSSENTISVVSRFVRAQFVLDDDCGIQEVISVFRTELALEDVDELAGFDMEAVDSLLRGGGDRTRLQATQDLLSEFRTWLQQSISQADTIVQEAQLGAIGPAGQGLAFDLETPSGISYTITLDYSDGSSSEPLINAIAGFEAVPEQLRLPVRKQVISYQFEIVDDEDEFPGILIDPNPAALPDGHLDDQKVWTQFEFLAAMIEIERSARALNALRPRTGRRS